jgi:hypothetical protein
MYLGMYLPIIYRNVQVADDSWLAFRKHSINPSIYQYTNKQSINQSISQSINQSINKSVSQSINKSVIFCRRHRRDRHQPHSLRSHGHEQHLRPAQKIPRRSLVRSQRLQKMVQVSLKTVEIFVQGLNTTGVHMYYVLGSWVRTLPE